MRRLFAHHEYVCTRHGYWIGPPDPTRDDTPSWLAVQPPELAAAQRAAQRQHGWAATFDATAAATAICIDLRFWAAHNPLWLRWEQRLDLLMPARWPPATAYRRSLFMAVIFPEVAALAAVLAAPGWQALAASDAPTDVNRFLHTTHNALGCADPPDRHNINDTLVQRMPLATGQLRQPAAAYPGSSHRSDGTPRVTGGRRIAERITAACFDRDRRAPRIPSPGIPMPYAFRLTSADAHPGSPRFDITLSHLARG